jgi:hypothetical protein
MSVFGGKKRSDLISDRRVHIARKGADGIPLLFSLLLCLFIVAVAALVPLALTDSVWAQILSWAVGVACAVLVVVSVKSLPEILIALLIYSFVYYATASSIIPTLMFSTVFCVSVFSALLASSKGIRLAIAIVTPIIAWGAAFAIAGDPISPFMSLLWLPAAIGVGLCSRKRKSKTICAAVFSVLACITGVAVAVAYIFTINKEISVDVIVSSFEYLRTESVNQTIEAIKLADTVEVTDGLIREIGGAVDSLINLMPGTIIFCATVLGYFVHRSKSALMDTFGLDELTAPSRERISSDVFRAFVFVLLFMTTFTTNSSGNLSFLATVGQNICLILSPVLVAVGWRTLKELPPKIGFFTVAVWIAMILFVAMSEISVLSVISLVGAFGTLIAATDKWAKNHYSDKSA